MANSFLETLQKNAIADNTSPALDILDEFCDAIRDFTSHRVDCWRTSGFSVNLGQEWKIMLKPRSRDYEQTLLRAYVPLKGFPTSLDLYGEDIVTCRSEAVLRQKLADFLKIETVVETILILSKQGADIE